MNIRIVHSVLIIPVDVEIFCGMGENFDLVVPLLVAPQILITIQLVIYSTKAKSGMPTLVVLKEMSKITKVLFFSLVTQVCVCVRQYM